MLPFVSPRDRSRRTSSSRRVRRSWNTSRSSIFGPAETASSLPGGEGGGAGSAMSCIEVSLSSIERAVSHSTNCLVRSRWRRSERRREVVS